MKCNEIVVNEQIIKSKIYFLRKEQVMFDFDLAKLYGYEARALNQQVKRNINRFPEDFMFQVSKEELDLVKSQFVISPDYTLFEGQGGGRRTLPYVFTEQGVYMLATVLRGELAEKQSIFIMRAFRELRHYVQQNYQFVTRSELNILAEQQKKTVHDVRQIQHELIKINENFVNNSELKEFVIYKGQKFESDLAYTNIYRTAKFTIFVIDNYVNIKTLDLLKHKRPDVSVTLFTENKKSKNGNLTNSVINDFNNEYPSLSIKPNPDSHDRFIIIDYKTQYEQVFHCGASSKDAGAKVCAINRIENTALIYPVVESLLTYPGN